jgi:hypothetical protein
LAYFLFHPGALLHHLLLSLISGIRRTPATVPIPHGQDRTLTLLGALAAEHLPYPSVRLPQCASDVLEIPRSGCSVGVSATAVHARPF